VSILVSGGAGYIGSVTVDHLRAAGERVVVVDDLSRGHRDAVDPDVPFYRVPVGDTEAVQRLVEAEEVVACIHLAAFAYVGESVSHPELYFRNNVEQGIRFVDALREAGVGRLVFSSSCATYGEPETLPLTEHHPQRPTSPYGWSKLILEKLLESYDRAHELRSVSLRYFNAAGATARRGECHEPEPHLIPPALRVAQGRAPHVRVFGEDYPTPDGTAVRDYVHVSDLARAHAAALDHLRGGGESAAFNLGMGRGDSVREVIEVARRVTGRDIPVQMEARRPGDASHLVAGAGAASKTLGWTPEFPDLDSILASAWEWLCEHSP